MTNDPAISPHNTPLSLSRRVATEPSTSASATSFAARLRMADSAAATVSSSRPSCTAAVRSFRNAGLAFSMSLVT